MAPSDSEAGATNGAATEPDDDTFDPDAETVTDDWEGVFVYASWGYGQTNVNFAQIVDVSDSGKTVKCKLVSTERVDSGKGSNSVRPTADHYGESFRLHVRNSGGDPVFRGSYPFVNGDPDEGTRLDSFFPFDNTPGKTVHETATGYGH